MNTIATFFAGIMVFFSGLFGVHPTITNVQPAAAVQSPTVSVVAATSTNVVPSGIQMLPRYVYNDFVPGYTKKIEQIYFEGLLVPTELEFENNPIDSKVVFRCWKSEMLCVYSSNHSSADKNQSRIFIMKISEWSKDKIFAKSSSTLDAMPNCEHEGCTDDTSLIVDLLKKKVEIKLKYCFNGCAEDKYIVSGDGDEGGKIKTKADFSKPKISLIPII